MSLICSFGSFSFHTERETWWEQGDAQIIPNSWEETGDTRLNAQQIPKRYGVFVDSAVLDGKTVRVFGRIDAWSKDVTRDKLAEMAKALNKGVQVLKLRSEYFYLARKIRWNYDYVPGSLGRVVQFNVEFLCADPFLYYAATESAMRTGNGVLPIAILEKAAYVWPKVTLEIIGPATANSLTVTDSWTEKSFTLAGSFDAGHELILDPKEFTVTYHDSSEVEEDVDALPYFSGNFLPAKYGSIWTVSGDATLAGVVTHVDWRQRFYL